MKFDVEITALKMSYRNVLLTDLHRLLDRLNSTVNSTQQECENIITELTDKEQSLGHLQGRVRTLR